ncbi:hypothetical protein F5Y13DRAFT_164031 [Hypoxylon sp. FL1857]|nr:hypothetical protein F5Y13DRAFT_164031 [Hypoxylon sp. FL1857]
MYLRYLVIIFSLIYFKRIIASGSTMSSQVPGFQDGFTRPLGNLENFFKLLAERGKPLRREHWSVHLALRLQLPSSITDPVPYLRRAWQVLRLQHPALGAILGQGQSSNDPTQPVPSCLTVEPLNIDTWANETFNVCDEFACADQLFSSLLSTPTATCYWLPKSSELLIRSSHWRTDGVGMALLGHDFMVALSGAIRSGYDCPLETLVPNVRNQPLVPPSLEHVARSASKFPQLKEGDEHSDLAAGADELVGIFLRGVPSIGLPSRAGSEAAIPGSSERVTTRLEAEITTKVATACKERGIKVTSAVHAAIVRVTASFPQHPLSKSYAAFVPVDLRRVIAHTAAPDAETISKSIGLYFSGLPVCVDSVLPEDGKPQKGFEAIARELGAVYARNLDEFWAPSGSSGQAISLLDLAEPYVRRTTALFNAPVPEGLPPVQTPDLSSLGKMESYLQQEYRVDEVRKVDVVDFWLGTEMLTRNVQFHVWSWNGALHLGACFNTSFYEKSFVIDILDKIIQELLLGCGLGE